MVHRAAERRDEVVHGFVSFADDRETPISKRVHKTTPAHPLTIADVVETHQALTNADFNVWAVAVPAWNSIVEVRKRAKDIEGR